LPNTFVALLLFVLLLAPGFAYLLVAERGPVPVREVTVLRETATVALGSVIANFLVLAAFGILRAFAPTITPDVGALVRRPELYARSHYLSLAWWLVALLAIACLAASAWAGVLNSADRRARLRDAKLFRWLHPEGGVHFNSAWWKAFREEQSDCARRVTCRLEDGSSVEGWLRSFNVGVEETADRGLILTAPLILTSPNGKARAESYGAVLVSERRIVDIYVDYQESVDGKVPDLAA
jgi:hypothetical protein